MGGAHHGRRTGRLVRQRGGDRPATGRVGPDDVGRRAHGRDARGTGGGADGVRLHLADLRAARGRSAPYLCRIHARAGWRGHPPDGGRERFRPAAGGRPRQGLRRQHRRVGARSWPSWSTTSMPPDAEAIAEQVFVALADPSRRAILAELASAGPATATDLAGSPADHPAGDRQAPGPAGRGRPGDSRAGGAAPGALPAALRADAGGAAVPGRAGPRLGRPARGVEEPPRRACSRARHHPTSRNRRTSWTQQ